MTKTVYKIHVYKSSKQIILKTLPSNILNKKKKKEIKTWVEVRHSWKLR